VGSVPCFFVHKLLSIPLNTVSCRLGFLYTFPPHSCAGKRGRREPPTQIKVANAANGNFPKKCLLPGSLVAPSVSRRNPPRGGSPWPGTRRGAPRARRRPSAPPPRPRQGGGGGSGLGDPLAGRAGPHPPMTSEFQALSAKKFFFEFGTYIEIRDTIRGAPLPPPAPAAAPRRRATSAKPPGPPAPRPSAAAAAASRTAHSARGPPASPSRRDSRDRPPEG